VVVASSSELRWRMGTKTAYNETVITRAASPPPPGCVPEPAMVQVIARHGSRHSGHIAEIDALAKRLGVRGYAEPGAVSSSLTSRGLRELYELGKRLGVSVQEYSPAAYPIRATFKSRAAQSAEAFALGALERAPAPLPFLEGKVGATAFVDLAPASEDLALRFFDTCDAYATTEVDESQVYLRGPEFMAALAAFRAKVAPAEVDQQDFLLAYEACAYELMLRDDDDDDAMSFCALIEDHVEVLEYAADLENWYENAGGNAMASSAPFVLLRSVFDAFQAFTADDADVRASWRFAHAETTLPLATMLGLFDAQPPLTAALRDPERLFRTSLVAPMAANLAVSLHECPLQNSKVANNQRSWRLRWTLNERDVLLPACHGELYCPLDTFEAAFHDALYLTDFTALCGNAPLPGGRDADLAAGPRPSSSSSNDDVEQR